MLYSDSEENTRTVLLCSAVRKLRLFGGYFLSAQKHRAITFSRRRVTDAVSLLSDGNLPIALPLHGGSDDFLTGAFD